MHSLHIFPFFLILFLHVMIESIISPIIDWNDIDQKLLGLSNILDCLCIKHHIQNLSRLGLQSLSSIDFIEVIVLAIESINFFRREFFIHAFLEFSSLILYHALIKIIYIAILIIIVPRVLLH